jgi:hypothetical protein
MITEDFEQDLEALIAQARLNGLTEQEVALLLREAANEVSGGGPW